MGNIIDMADRFNNSNKQNKKEKFKIRKEHFIKDFANLTFNPNFYGKYKLDKRYRDVQLGSRIAIGAVVAALGIGSVGAISSSYRSDNPSKTEITYETLSRDTVFTEAKTVLSDIIVPNDNASVHVGFPTRDEFRNINSVEVSELIGTDYCSKYKFNISNKEDKKNNPELYNKFIEKLIEVANSSSPSQNVLQELQDLTEQVQNLNLQLQGEHIVDLDAKQIDNER